MKKKEKFRKVNGMVRMDMELREDTSNVDCIDDEGKVEEEWRVGMRSHGSSRICSYEKATWKYIIHHRHADKGVKKNF